MTTSSAAPPRTTIVVVTDVAGSRARLLLPISKPPSLFTKREAQFVKWQARSPAALTFSRSATPATTKSQGALSPSWSQCSPGWAAKSTPNAPSVWRGWADLRKATKWSCCTIAIILTTDSACDFAALAVLCVTGSAPYIYIYISDS